ncbi:TPA: 5'/3'-nucleotidase SurE [Candidatus Poribacteria bacterium]|nr:5'/3'-nucleotidase SurE [Candidatus Poribacteria bacterium]
MILITNDDGIESEGLKALARVMESLDTVYVVAPDRERSATGMSVTLRHPLRVQKIADRTYAVDGTPVDCVNLALGVLMPTWPKILISGINEGSNLGNDIYYSGTVAAAIRGAFLKIPAIAISIVDIRPYHYDTAADIALRIAKSVLQNGIPAGTLLNVNVPDLPLSEIQGIEITRQDRTSYLPTFEKRIDPKGFEYYWLRGYRENPKKANETDLYEVYQKKVSITPLQLDLTDYKMVEELSRWDW